MPIRVRLDFDIVTGNFDNLLGDIYNHIAAANRSKETIPVIGPVDNNLPWNWAFIGLNNGKVQICLLIRLDNLYLLGWRKGLSGEQNENLFYLVAREQIQNAPPCYEDRLPFSGNYSDLPLKKICVNPHTVSQAVDALHQTCLNVVHPQATKSFTILIVAFCASLRLVSVRRAISYAFASGGFGKITSEMFTQEKNWRKVSSSFLKEESLECEGFGIVTPENASHMIIIAIMSSHSKFQGLLPPGPGWDAQQPGARGGRHGPREHGRGQGGRQGRGQLGRPVRQGGRQWGQQRGRQRGQQRGQWGQQLAVYILHIFYLTCDSNVKNWKVRIGGVKVVSSGPGEGGAHGGKDGDEFDVTKVDETEATSAAGSGIIEMGSWEHSPMSLFVSVSVDSVRESVRGLITNTSIGGSVSWSGGITFLFPRTHTHWSDIITGDISALLESVNRLDDKLDEQKEISGIIKKEVTDAHLKTMNIGTEINSSKQLVWGLDEKMNSMEDKQDATKLAGKCFIGFGMKDNVKNWKVRIGGVKVVSSGPGEGGAHGGKDGDEFDVTKVDETEATSAAGSGIIEMGSWEHSPMSLFVSVSVDSVRESVRGLITNTSIGGPVSWSGGITFLFPRTHTHWSDIITGDISALLESVNRLDDKLDEQKEISGLIKKEVTDAHLKTMNIGTEINSSKQLVWGLDENMNSMEDKQNFSCGGVMYLCQFIEGKGGKMPDLLLDASELAWKRFIGCGENDSVKHLIEAFESGAISNGADDKAPRTATVKMLL